MGDTGLAGGLGAATARLERVLDGLRTATPEAVYECAALVEKACRDLAGAGEAGPTGGDTGELAAAMQLRARIRQARRLLDGFYLFHTRWGQLLGSRTGGYLPGGLAAPVAGIGRLYVRG